VIAGTFSTIRYALRAFRRDPLFTAVAAVSLALGTGANTAVFTLLDQLVLREVLTLVAAGLIAGVPATYLLSRYASSQLFGVTPADAWNGIAATVILGTVAAAAAYAPARRASAIDPITALRHE
jgi:hypothetical protein